MFYLLPFLFSGFAMPYIPTMLLELIFFSILSPPAAIWIINYVSTFKMSSTLPAMKNIPGNYATIEDDGNREGNGHGKN